MRDDDIIDAAREIGGELPSLLGPDAEPVATRLNDLLARVESDPAVVDDVLALLAAHPVTREELARRLPEEQDAVRASYPGGLPGWPSGSDAAIYVCRSCDYRYPVFEEGESVPPCPRGHGPLVRGG